MIYRLMVQYPEKLVFLGVLAQRTKTYRCAFGRVYRRPTF
jgi:hypothetical protein